MSQRAFKSNQEVVVLETIFELFRQKVIFSHFCVPIVLTSPKMDPTSKIKVRNIISGILHLSSGFDKALHTINCIHREVSKTGVTLFVIFAPLSPLFRPSFGGAKEGRHKIQTITIWALIGVYLNKFYIL